jgi:hypothetical protein
MSAFQHRKKAIGAGFALGEAIDLLSLPKRDASALSFRTAGYAVFHPSTGGFTP